jgi:AcrR family transcriptional regulator
MVMALGKEDWIREALFAIAEGGSGAVAVEPLAKRLGATKGSFYWHFADRQALVGEALAFWEREYTDAAIGAVERIADPHERIATLLGAVMEDDREGQADVGLLGSAYDPLVAPVFARVQRKRFAFLERCFRDAGFTPAAARHRARIAYGGFVAWFEQRRVDPGSPPSARELRAYQRTLLALLLAPDR